MKSDEYGDRMKSYEHATRTVLPRRTFTIIRVDGRAFHTHLRSAKKPFDPDVIRAMRHTAREMCREIHGIQFAYTQSDEISFLLTDFGSRTEPWFGGVVQKMASVSASMATAAFNDAYGPRGGSYATFDSRVYTIPDRTEVLNYFLWRQQDAIRNAVSMAAQAHFSHKSLHGQSTAEMQERLFQEKGINFKTDYPDEARRGSYAFKRAYADAVSEEHQKDHGRPPYEIRSEWQVEAAPDFKIWDGSDLSDLVPYNGAGPEQKSLVYRLGYPMGRALLDTAMEPAGALWAAETIRAEYEDMNLFRAWMIGTNPHLNDAEPVTMLLAGKINEVMKAHRAYLAGDFA